MGGIMNAIDAIEFFMAGATAVEIGVANFIEPAISVKIAEGIEEWLVAHHIDDIHDIIGALKL